MGVNEFGGLNAASRGLYTEIFRTLSQSVNRAIGFAVAYKRSTRAGISNKAENYYWVSYPCKLIVDALCKIKVMVVMVRLTPS
jgi:hypothetical protein